MAKRKQIDFDAAGEFANAQLKVFKRAAIEKVLGKKGKNPDVVISKRRLENFGKRIKSLKRQLDEANELIKKLRKDARSMRSRLSEVTKEEAASMNLEMMFPKQTPKKNVRRKKKARPSKLESLPGSDFKN